MLRRVTRTPVPTSPKMISTPGLLSQTTKGQHVDDFDIVAPSPTQRPHQTPAPSLSVMEVINARESEIETEISRIKAMIVDIANLEDELVKVRAAKAALMGYTADFEVELDTEPQKKPRKKRTKNAASIYTTQMELDRAVEAAEILEQEEE